MSTPRMRQRYFGAICLGKASLLQRRGSAASLNSRTRNTLFCVQPVAEKGKGESCLLPRLVGHVRKVSRHCILHMRSALLWVLL